MIRILIPEVRNQEKVNNSNICIIYILQFEHYLLSVGAGSEAPCALDRPPEIRGNGRKL